MSEMNEKNIWVWVGGVVVVVVLLLLGYWFWGGSGSQVATNTDYGTASTTGDALEGPGAPVVLVVPEPTGVANATVAGIISSLSNESRFAGLLASTGVVGSVAGKGPYTVFVPTNAAFGLLPPGSLNLNVAGLKRLVQYHIVSGKKIDVNIQQSGTITALSKDMLNFSVLAGDKSARINSSVALRAYKASNGIVYVVSAVLLPPYDAQQQ